MKMKTNRELETYRRKLHEMLPKLQEEYNLIFLAISLHGTSEYSLWNSSGYKRYL
jgi:hypothetical protein